MEYSIKTVEAGASNDLDIISNSTTDSLYSKQIQEVSNMRAALLSCDSSNLRSVKTTMKNILVMQLTRNMSRIVKFSEVMDRLEDRLYQSVDYKISTIDDEADPSGLYQLLKIQSQLIESMNESQKLLEPYLNGKYNLDPIFTEVIEEAPAEDSFGTKLIDKDSREKIRNSAQAVLNAINGVIPTSSNNTINNTSSIQSEDHIEGQLSLFDMIDNDNKFEGSSNTPENTDSVTNTSQSIKRGSSLPSPEELDKQLGIITVEDDVASKKKQELEELNSVFDAMAEEETFIEHIEAKAAEIEGNKNTIVVELSPQPATNNARRSSEAAKEALKMLHRG